MNTLKRVIFVLTISVVSLSLCWGQAEVITILHVNDTHSTLASVGPRTPFLKGTQGGLERAATVIAATRLTEPHVLALHAGDLFVGDMFFNVYFGVPELRALKLLGFDAMAVGNHEFDLTPAVLLQSLTQAFPRDGFPLLSANLNLDAPEVQGLKKFIKPYSIRQVGRVKVGIFGLTTPTTNVLSQPSPAVVSENFVEIAAGTVEALQAERCDVIICLSHLGIAYDQLVAQYVPGIHVIVGGHDHLITAEPIKVINPVGEPTWIVQANAFYLNVGKMRLSVNKGKVRLLDYRMITIDERIPREPITSGIVHFLVSGIEKTYGPVFSQKIGYVARDFAEVADSLLFAGPKDTPIGNLVSDAFRAATGTQIAIEAGGSTAQPLYHGPIVPADLFRVVGYGFNTDNGLGYRLATFDLLGADIYKGLEFGLSNIQENDEFLMQVSGMSYVYNPNAPPFARLVSVSVGGTDLDPSATYSVTANEFAPMFLNYLGIPYSNLQIQSGVTEFQVLADYVSRQAILQPDVEGRILSSPALLSEKHATPSVQSVAAVPEQFALRQNYPNPFNPNTTIAFSLPATSFVTLKVCNLLGQEVAVLVNEQLPAGTYAKTFRADGLASGMYLYKITAGDFVQTKRMVLLK